MDKEEILKKRIKDIQFSIRTQNLLEVLDISTVEELLKYSASDLLRFRNFGKKSIREIRNILGALGFCLKDDLLISDQIVREQLMNFPEMIKQMESAIREMIRKLNILQQTIDIFYIKRDPD